MTPEDRNKRDLPEVVADILIEQQAIRATLGQMQQQLDRHERLLELQYEQQQLMFGQMQRQYEQQQRFNEQQQRFNEQQQRFNEQQQQFNEHIQQQLDQLIHGFNGMTNAILDAMNRQTDRYNLTADTSQRQQTDIVDLQQRVGTLEQKIDRQAS